MRQGELLGLKWKDVDLENGIISVKNNLKRVPGWGLVISKPKTESSIRSIRIGNRTIKESNSKNRGGKREGRGIMER